MPFIAQNLLQPLLSDIISGFCQNDVSHSGTTRCHRYSCASLAKFRPISISRVRRIGVTWSTSGFDGKASFEFYVRTILY